MDYITSHDTYKTSVRTSSDCHRCDTLSIVGTDTLAIVKVVSTVFTVDSRLMQRWPRSGRGRRRPLAPLTHVVRISGRDFFGLVARQLDAASHFGGDGRFVSSLSQQRIDGLDLVPTWNYRDDWRFFFTWFVNCHVGRRRLREEWRIAWKRIWIEWMWTQI